MKAKGLFVLCTGLLAIAVVLVYQRIARASPLGAGFDSSYSGSVVLDSWVYAAGESGHDDDAGDLSTSGSASTNVTVGDTGSSYASGVQVLSWSPWGGSGFGFAFDWYITQPPYYVNPPPVGIADVEAVGDASATVASTVYFSGSGEFQTQVPGSSAPVQIYSSISASPSVHETQGCTSMDFGSWMTFRIDISTGAYIEWDGSTLTTIGPDGNPLGALVLNDGDLVSIEGTLQIGATVTTCGPHVWFDDTFVSVDVGLQVVP